jgi:hypothetical protein
LSRLADDHYQGAASWQASLRVGRPRQFELLFRLAMTPPEVFNQICELAQQSTVV